MALISIGEYASRIGKNPKNVLQKIKRGNLPAVKSGNFWLIEEDEPYEDHRKGEFYRQSDYYKRRLAAAEKRKKEKKGKHDLSGILERAGQNQP